MMKFSKLGILESRMDLLLTRTGRRKPNARSASFPFTKKIVRTASTILASIVFTFSAAAQAPSVAPEKNAPEKKTLEDPLGRTSPQSSVLAFLDAARANDYARATRYLDLGAFTPQQRLSQGPGLAQQLAALLNSNAQFDVAALSRDPEGDRGDGLPPNREQVASFRSNGSAVTLDLQRDELRSGISIWRFSPDSVQRVPELAQMRTSSPIERMLPAPLVTWTLVGTPLWRWIALLAAAILLAALSRLISRIALFLLKQVLRRVAHHMNWSVLDLFVGPFQLLLSVALFRAAVEAINPSALVRLYLGYILGLLSISGVAWLCMRIIDLSVARLRIALNPTHRTFARAVLPLASRALKIAVAVFAATAVLSSWGHPPTTLLAGVGIGGIAIALAAQKTVENLFGGVAVISDRPVYVGDYCKFGDSAGTVEDIGLRSTRIRTADRTLMVVPNSQFSTMTLENFSRRDKMSFHPTLNLRRDTTPDQVRTILASFQKILEGHPKVESGSMPVRFVGVGTYSLDVEIFVYILTQDSNDFLQIQQELLLRILDAVAAAGTALAVPTSIVYPGRQALGGQENPQAPFPDGANAKSSPDGSGRARP